MPADAPQMDAILRMLADRGDNVLVENFCYVRAVLVLASCSSETS